MRLFNRRGLRPPRTPPVASRSCRRPSSAWSDCSRMRAGGRRSGSRGTGIGAGLVTAAHDCAEGGVAVALAEACVTGKTAIGCEAALPAAARADLTLFGEGPSRVVVAVDGARARAFE